MINKKNTTKILFIFLISHLLIWTLIPSLTNLNLPLDTIEALAWGSNLEWGFNKHPPFSAFAVEVIYQVFGKQDWAYYLLSQIFVVSAFYFVFKLSNEFLNNSKLALISLLLLEGIFFYNFTTPEFNVNVSQLPFWALSVYFTWRCIKFDKTIDYVFLGIFAGLGILSKYLFVYLLIGVKLLFIYLISKKKKIKIFNLLIAGPVTLLILLPHIIWLINNDYTTIYYGLQRTGGVGNFFDHIIYPLLFLGKQIGILAPFILLFFSLNQKFKLKINYKDEKLIFLIFTIIVPIMLMVLTSASMGVKIRTMWMTPFYLFSGLLIIYLYQKMLKKINLKKFGFVFLVIFLLSPLTYLIVSLSSDDKRTDYPGGEIARLVQDKWDKNFSNEIKIVIGDEWSAGNLSYHLYSRPKWMQTLKSDISDLNSEQGIVYTGNSRVLKKVCPGVFGVIRPVGYCMIGRK
tara:strand:- start:689 stop:2062 length:1374 start_codon:yes stop_codon:yes gene_type:complete